MNKKFNRELPLVIAFFFVIIFAGFDIANSQKVNAANIVKAGEPTPASAVETPFPQKQVVGTDEPTEENIINYIKRVFGKNWVMAVKIARCESHLRPNAVNQNWRNGKVWSTDYGLFQINGYFHRNKADVENLTWKQNVDLAKVIYDAQGWNAWTCYKFQMLSQ